MGWFVFFLALSGQILASVVSYLCNNLCNINLSDYPFSAPLLYLLIFVPPLFFVLKNRILTNTRLNDKCSVTSPIVWFLIPLLFFSSAVLISSLPAPSQPQWYLDKMRDMISQENIFWSILTVSLLAPFFEELIFRRIIEEDFLSRYSPAVAVTLSSAAFAAIHFNLWQGIPAFFYGLLFGVIYYKFRNIWITFALHSLNNSISIAVAYIFRENLQQALLPLRYQVGDDLKFCLIIIVAIIIFVTSFYLIDRKVKVPRGN